MGFAHTVKPDNNEFPGSGHKGEFGSIVIVG